MRDTFHPNSQRWFEVAAVVVTGLLFLLFRYLRLQGVFVPVAASLWTGFVWYHARRDPSILRTWGFRLDTFWPAFQATTAFSLPFAGVMALVGGSRGTLSFPPHAWILVALYPIWGVVQQFLVQALLVRNLEGSLPRYGLFLVGSCLFAIVHVPEIPLMLTTFGLGLVYIPIYLRYRNLWPLGLYHGWLGTLFYLWVLGRDPWVETFGIF
jgi:membrane protease YdiL (CAAX protease family)